jgi:hypothetical protein
MLGCRLVIDWQMRGRTEEEDELELDSHQPEAVIGAKRKQGQPTPLEAKKKN